jgi:hypothetical protein
MSHPLLDAIEIIHATKEHESFIYSSWLNTYSERSEIARRIGSRRFFKMHHGIIERILNDTPRILVIAMREDPNIIFGYLVAKRKTELCPVIHFCFVKPAFREMGFAKLLVRALDWDFNKCFYTHVVDDMNWMLSKFPGMKYYPYLT